MKYEHCPKCRHEVLWFSLTLNVALSAFKGSLGVISGSAALVADAFHSSADVIANAVTLVCMRISHQPADKEHPYGHGQIQYVSSSVVGLILILGATGLLVGSLKNIFTGDMEPPSRLALLGAVASVVANELMFHYHECVGKENNSPAIIANGWDNRSDAISSLGVTIGIILATFGYPMADPIAAIAVSLVVMKIGVEISKTAIKGLMDSSPELTDLKKIHKIVSSVPGVSGITYLRARGMGESLEVEVEARVNGDLKVYEGDLIVELIRDKILEGVEHSTGMHIYIAPADGSAQKERGKKSLWQWAQ
jgi:cation diffusion facilitator family transporter